MGQKQVEVAVPVEVVGDYTHPGLGLTMKVVGDSQNQRVIAEGEGARCSDTLVDPQLIGIGVVGDVDVLPAVGVDVEANDSQAGSEGAGQAGGLGDIAKRTVTLVVEQKVVNRPERFGAAEVPSAVLGRASLAGQVVDVAGDVEVEVPVPIEIAEGGRR